MAKKNAIRQTRYRTGSSMNVTGSKKDGDME